MVEKLTDSTLLARIESLLTILYSLSKQEVVDFCREFVPEFSSTNEEYAVQDDCNKVEKNRI